MDSLLFVLNPDLGRGGGPPCSLVGENTGAHALTQRGLRKNRLSDQIQENLKESLGDQTFSDPPGGFSISCCPQHHNLTDELQKQIHMRLKILVRQLPPPVSLMHLCPVNILSRSSIKTLALEIKSNKSGTWAVPLGSLEMIDASL